MTITAEDLVHREVHYCVSGIVNRMATLEDEAATELCMPLDDWEEAAREHGAKFGTMTRADNPEHGGKIIVRDAPEDSDMAITFYDDHQNAAIAYCDYFDVEPSYREIYEHWAVSDWLADRLAEKGEKVDENFYGITVWARTTTGQGIASDSVIEAIVADLNREA